MNATPKTGSCRENRDRSKRPIGKDNAFVRALNFSGSGFDTVMQLGVAHALLVIQGRAPDIITGVSAGAIQAAAVAEILQAGDCVELDMLDGREWNDLTPDEQLEIHEIRQHARVARLREFAGAVHRVPEEFVDAALPDAHQIDERAHLTPLMRPLNSDKERRSQIRLVSARAGLVKLYNELLDLPLSIGTLTRIARHVLGIVSAPEVRGFGRRILAYIAEILPLWLLIGQKLVRLSRVLRLLILPYKEETLKCFRRFIRRFGNKYPPDLRDADPGSEAGTIISHQKSLHLIRRAIVDMVAFLVLLASWLAVSWLVLLSPIIFTSAVFAMFSDNFDGEYFWFVAAVPVLLLLVVLAIAAFRQIIDDPLKILKASAVGVTLIVLIGYWTLVLAVALDLLFYAFGMEFLLPSVQVPLVQEPLSFTSVLTWMQNSEKPMIGSPFVVIPFVWLLFVISMIVTLKKNFTRKFLEAHDLSKSLLPIHPLRMILVELFDPGFYGEPDMDKVIEQSLKDENAPSSRNDGEECNTKHRCISWYDDSEKHVEPITLGLAVVDVISGNVGVVPTDQPVVTGLMAATAITPWFVPQKLDPEEGLFVDAASIAGQPSRVLFDMLEDRKNLKSKTIHMYNVAPLPFDVKELPLAPDENGDKPSPPPYLHLVDVVRRAMSLQRFRDAQLDRKLTELYTSAIPPSMPNIKIKSAGDSDDRQKFFRAWVTPVELNVPANLNPRILCANKYDRRDEISRTIADGCRASLEVMIRGSAGSNEIGEYPSCRDVVHTHLTRRIEHTTCADGTPNTSLTELRLPGSDEETGPGLSEICKHCKFTDDNGKVHEQCLNIRDFAMIGPVWPHQRENKCDFEVDDPHFVSEFDLSNAQQRSQPRAFHFERETSLEIETYEEGIATIEMNRTIVTEETSRLPDRQWPAGNDKDHPTVTLLFSGGVFRGVYQVGVVNALNAVGLKPDLIAGASVGSLTAALVARIFAEESPQNRLHKITRLASVYLALDRIILTDRFADFIRNLTIRAVQTDFSLQDADLLFRKYDYRNSIRFTKRSRRVIAGIERLFYISPFQLAELVRTVRERNTSKTVDLLEAYTQQWLDRMQVSQQVLGAEPLRLLADQFVLDIFGSADERLNVPVSVDAFLEKWKIAFLITATNLTVGRLEVLGKEALSGTVLPWEKPALREALLASSAFPGIFRPRWSWELEPATCNEHQLIDGGAFDNLPVQPAMEFLVDAAANGRINYRPKPVVDGQCIDAPHLVFAASLRPKLEKYAKRDVPDLEGYWPKLRTRAGQLAYNNKIDSYSSVEKHLQQIWKHVKNEPTNPGEELTELLDIEMVSVKPNWLCGTFGFHPMLGFRRENQAKSIAHGCATTLLKFGELRKERGDEVLKAWNVRLENVPKREKLPIEKDKDEWKEIRRKDGRCWLNPDMHCPFSVQAPKDHLRTKTYEEIGTIYKVCQTKEAHFK